MRHFNFACCFKKVEDGSLVIKCRDLPGLLSWATNSEPLESWARYAVEDYISFMIKDGLAIPFASLPEAGEYVVELSPTVEAKILLHNEMVKENVGRSNLAEKAGLTLPEVTRLLNIKHKTKIDSLADALSSLGKRLNLSIETM